MPLGNFSYCLLLEGWEYALRPTYGGAGGKRYHLQEDTCSVDERLGKFGGNEVVSVSVFRFSEEVRSLSSCVLSSYSVFLSFPRLCAPLCAQETGCPNYRAQFSPLVKTPERQVKSAEQCSDCRGINPGPASAGLQGIGALRPPA